MVVSYTQEHVYRHPWHRGGVAQVHGPGRARRLRGARAHPRRPHAVPRRGPPLRPPARHRGPDPAAAAAPPPRPPRAGGGVVVLCVERTDVDAPARDMRVASRNATLRGLVDVEERCSYAPHPERPDEWTLFRQETTIRCAPLAAVAARVAELVERRCAERFTKNADKGREVVERICADLAAEQDAIHEPR